MFELLGKFHPLLVHLPIGFLVLLTVLEWRALSSRHKDLSSANRLILLLTMPVTAASVLCGWLLADGNDYNSQTLFWHRWLGTALLLAVVLLWIIRQRGWMTLYRRSLGATMLLLIVASHYGGSLTHGSGFLAWPKPRIPGTATISSDELLPAPVYITVVQPILAEYCVSCHGEQKTKGGLRLDSAAHLVNGGDSGDVLLPAGATTSLLGKRINLPIEEDDHMPPDGKPQLTEAQLATLRWWLNSGARSDSSSLASLKPGPEMIQTIVKALSQLNMDSNSTN